MTARALAADDSLQVLALARSGQLRAARKLIRSALRRAKADAQRFDDDSMRATVAELGRLAQALPSLVPAAPRPRKHAARHKRGMPAVEATVRPSEASARAAKKTHAAAMQTLGFSG